MTTAATISARLILDSKPFDDGLKNSGKKAKDFQTNMSNMGASMMRTGSMMTAGLTVPIAAAGWQMVSAAADYQEAGGAIETVFGDMSGAIDDFSEKSAETVGMSAADFKQLSAVGGALLKNLGFDASEAADEMVKLTERGADLGAVFNAETSTALNAVQSALKGEFNPLEQFGVKMNAASIEAKALAMGLAGVSVDTTKLNGLILKQYETQKKYAEAVEESGVNSLDAAKEQQKLVEISEQIAKVTEGKTEALTDEMKAQAALALFYEQTADVQGAFARESDGVTGSMKVLKAQMTDQARVLGEQLLPYVLKALQYFSELMEKFQALSPEQKGMILKILALVAVLGPAITIIGGLVSAIGAIIPVVTAVVGVISLPILALIAAIALLAFLWNKYGKQVTQTVKQLGVIIKFYFAKMKKDILKLWLGMGNAISTFWTNLWTGIKNKFLEIKASIIEKISGMLVSIIRFFTDIEWSTIGKNMVRGIVNGIASLTGWAWSQMTKFARGMSDSFKNFFGISSPSKLFEDYGKNMTAGLIIGLEPMSDTMLDTENSLGDSFGVSNKNTVINLTLPSGVITKTMMSDILGTNNAEFSENLAMAMTL